MSDFVTYVVKLLGKGCPLWASVIFVELFCVGEKIGFEVLDFGPAGPDTEPGQRTFSVFWFS